MPEVLAAPSLARACMIFGWSANDCLEMPASRFFAFLRAGAEIEQTRDNTMFVALCDVSSISLGNPKHYENVRNAFISRVPRPASIHQRPATPSSEYPNEQEAKSAMFALFGAARRFV